jgi:hypothetical protein
MNLVLLNQRKKLRAPESFRIIAALQFPAGKGRKMGGKILENKTPNHDSGPIFM